MILNIILTTVLVFLAAAIIYFVFAEMIKIKNFKNELFKINKKANLNQVIEKEKSVYDKFVNTDMSFEEIKDHALNIEKVKKELSGSSSNATIEVDYVTASQILKNWDKKVLISEDGKIVLTNIKKNVTVKNTENEKLSSNIIHNETPYTKKDFFPLEEVTKIDADFDKIINEQKIKFEDAFYDYLLKENFSNFEAIKESLKTIIEKNFNDVVKHKNELYIKAEIFFKSLLELNDNDNFNIIDEDFIEKYLNEYTTSFNEKHKQIFIQNINANSNNIFYINEKNRFTKYSFFVVNEKEENELIIEGNFIIINNSDFIPYQLFEASIFIPNFGGAELYKNKRKEESKKQTIKEEPIF